MVSVTIIGIGRVGGALAIGLPKDRYLIDNLICRDVSNLPSCFKDPRTFANITTLTDVDTISSDVVFIATRDSQIVEAASSLRPKLHRSSTVFHMSGALPSAVLGDLRTVNCSVGSIHPLVSISEPEMGPKRFVGAFFCVEGDSPAVEKGRQIASDLQGRPFSIDAKYKTLYHAAAVMSCGHVVALFDAAVEMLTKCGLTANESRDVLLPLARSTVMNLSEQSTADALTGTFARADLDTLTRHLTALNENVSEELLEIYLLLGERSLEIAASQGANSERIDKMRAKMTIAKSKLKW